MKRDRDPKLARKTVESIRLLNEGELQLLFPEGRIVRERIGLFSESLTALHGPNYGHDS